jgi:hypothetical protein
MKRATRMTVASGTTTLSNASVATRKPSTAESTDTDGVISASP